MIFNDQWSSMMHMDYDYSWIIIMIADLTFADLEIL